MKKKLTQNVNKDKLFNDLPKVRPEMSKWATRFSNYQSCNLGQIVPIYYDEVLPGEKRKITMAMCSHTTTPIAPIFNSLYTEIRSFVVPIRLCADLLNGYKTRKSPWVKVFGEDPSSTSADIVVPLGNQKLPDFTEDHQFIKDLYAYTSNASTTDNVFESLDVFNLLKKYLKDYNYLALAAYELIYQRHYRNENYEAATSSPLYKLLFDAYNSSRSSVSLSTNFTFEMANREKDYFTGMKPFTQKGDAPRVGLLGEAPIVGVAPITGEKNMDEVRIVSDKQTIEEEEYNRVSLETFFNNSYKSWIRANEMAGSAVGDWNGSVSTSKLVADLKSVNGISIEELRLLIKTQELLEKDAMYGSMYAESLNAHFGTCPIDLTLQDPQEIYKTTITSQMQAIFQTSSTASEESILGTIGANSTTQTDPFVIMPETEFKEHSIIMVCAVHKLQNVYAGMYFKPKFNLKKARFDFYTPELNDLGYQAVTDKEFLASSSPVAGFNEAFAEYRYKFNKVHGSLVETFPYWAPAITYEYASAAALYKEGFDILDKALSVRSSTAPQFYDAWGFEEENTKPMSLHSIPGMDGVI